MKKFKKAILPIALSISVIGLAGCSTGGTKYISSKAGDVTEKDIVESIGASQLSKTATSMMIQKVLLDKYKNKIDQKTIDEQLQKAQEQYGGKDKFEQLLKQQGFTLDKYKDGDGYKSYNDVTKKDRKALADAVNALGEPLSKMAVVTE